MINSFHGKYRFLSNFWPCEVWYEKDSYPSVEHAYQAAKTTDLAVRAEIRLKPEPGKAKKAGKHVQLRPDWDKIRLDVMRDLVRQKFSVPALRQMLLDTGDEELVEGNRWGDVFWGVCDGKGENWLGKILMETRTSLRDSHVRS